jgi:predicted Zn finger-like uncharacterized protein
MQFSCESCKANLQIADEKIRGKRLIVRCKRCGVQIRIVDPALLPSQSSARPPSGKLRASPEPRPPAGASATGSAARSPASRRDSDTEDTRAMESEVLEKALRASKAEEAPPSAAAGPPAPRIAPPPPPPREPPPPRDPAIWFAMIRGQQEGPITRAELALQASAGKIGPRTYLWKEGMEAWIRAKDVPELVPLFAAPPTPPPPPGGEAPAERGQGTPGRGIELPFEIGARGASTASAGMDVEESASPDAPTPPGGTRVPDESGPTPVPEEGPSDQSAASHVALSPGALDLARWGASELSKPRAQTPTPLPKAAPPAAGAPELRFGQPERRDRLPAIVAAIALVLVGGILALVFLSGRKDRALEPAAQGGAETGSAPARPPAEGEHKPEEKLPSAAAGDPSAQAPAPSPDDLKRKVDESKPVLQGCVDEALKRDPSLHVGKILISATIAPSGAVTSARIDQKAVDQSALGACLKSAARKLQFAPFTGDAFAMDIPIVVTGEP